MICGLHHPEIDIYIQTYINKIHFAFWTATKYSLPSARQPLVSALNQALYSTWRVVSAAFNTASIVITHYEDSLKLSSSNDGTRTRVCFSGFNHQPITLIDPCWGPSSTEGLCGVGGESYWPSYRFIITSGKKLVAEEHNHVFYVSPCVHFFGPNVRAL